MLLLSLDITLMNLNTTKKIAKEVDNSSDMTNRFLGRASYTRTEFIVYKYGTDIGAC